MSGARNDVARRKLHGLASYVRELEEVRPANLAAYREDVRDRRSVERLLQLLVESGSEVVQRLLLLSGRPAPGDYAGTFRAASDAVLVSADLAEELVSFAGLRNILVHEYEKVDDAVVHARSGRAIPVFTRLVAEVRRSLRRI